MIDELHDAMRTLLREEGALPEDAVGLAFEAPTRRFEESLLTPTVAFFLHAIGRNTERRESAPIERRGAGTATRYLRPPLFDLRYLVTAHAGTAADEHALLWRTLSVLVRNPEIALGDAGSTATLEIGAGQERSHDLLGPLDAAERAAFALTVTVPCELGRGTEAPLVLQRILRTTGPGGAPASVRRHGGGVLADEDGRALADVLVSTPDGRRSTRTDEGGRWRLPGDPDEAVVREEE